ncbi:hypothetical protein D9758_016656 [Tetrapyrgos nigripes]|uniref:PITH domain-containing protein n=1 Tax=Tetrapyrgos nigripes TaxID=182062 RepID=A0A8H5CG87_9AGAR|nr:hypothetical protein D9758_016656 [Tetrapyrgos nigripes]
MDMEAMRKAFAERALQSSAPKEQGDVGPTTLHPAKLSIGLLTQLNCLNESSDHTLKSIVESKARNTTSSYLESDADEQLLLNIPVRLSSSFHFDVVYSSFDIYPALCLFNTLLFHLLPLQHIPHQFNQTVRVKSLIIKSTSSPSSGPKIVKLAVNRPSMGFEDVEDADEPAVAQVLELSDEDVKEGKSVALRFVRFQNVNSLHIFVGSNHGGEDVSRIDAIDIIGVPVDPIARHRHRDMTPTLLFFLFLLFLFQTSYTYIQNTSGILAIEQPPTNIEVVQERQ